MNARDYQLYLDGRQAAARGAGLSDAPYGGTDGFLWRRGVAAWLDEHGDENDQAGAGRPPAQKTTLQDGPGVAISARPVPGHPPKQDGGRPTRSFADFWIRTRGPVPGTKSRKVGK